MEIVHEVIKDIASGKKEKLNHTNAAENSINVDSELCGESSSLTIANKNNDQNKKDEVSPNSGILKIINISEINNEELDQKIFRNKVTDLPLPQELVLKMKSVPEELLLHRESPILSEEELLLICSDSLSENIFRGFSVRLLETENVFRFEFESMRTLNTFLTRMLDPEKAFFGFEAMESKRKLHSMKKYRKRIYPLGLKMDSSNIVDLNEMGKKYGFKVFTKKIAVDKFISVDFRSPKDLYKFLTIETNFGFRLKTTEKHQSQTPKKGQGESVKASVSGPHVSPAIQQQSWKPIKIESEGPQGADGGDLGGDGPSHGVDRGHSWRGGQYRGSFEDVRVGGFKRQGSNNNDMNREVKRGGFDRGGSQQGRGHPGGQGGGDRGHREGYNSGSSGRPFGPY